MEILRLVSMLILFVGIAMAESDEDNENYRAKRQINNLPLVYPYGAMYKLIIGISGPIPNTDAPLLLVANFQYQYLQFQNISELSQYYFIKEVSREQRDADLERRKDERYIFYKSVADLLDMKGFNGNECVLRAICEAAQYPVEEDALVGELMHILLTPDYGRSPFEKDPDWDAMMFTYVDAAVAGRQMFNCASVYSYCPEGQGLLEIISTLKDK